MKTTEILEKKLERILEAGSKKAEKFLPILEENTNIRDVISPLRSLNFSFDSEEAKRIYLGQEQLDVHNNGIIQICNHFKIPAGSISNLSSGISWKRNLAQNILNGYTSNFEGRERLLVRIVNNEARAILTDRYKRFNSLSVYKRFFEKTGNYNAKIADMYSSSLKNWIEVIIPEIFEIETPRNGTVKVLFGARISSSDFGLGALEIRTFLIQVICSNGLVSNNILRKVHLGQRLPDNILLSEETFRKETEALSAILDDVINSLFSTESIMKRREAIIKTSSNLIDLEKEVKKLSTKGVNKEESEMIQKELINNDASHGIQGESTLWKLVQSIGTVANNVNEERKRELHEIAGEYLEFED